MNSVVWTCRGSSMHQLLADEELGILYEVIQAILVLCKYCQIEVVQPGCLCVSFHRDGVKVPL